MVPEIVLGYEFELAGGPGAEWRLQNDWLVSQEAFDVFVKAREESETGVT